MSGKVIITVSPTGEVTSEVKGIKGNGCQDADKAILKALGTVTKETKTPEFHQRAAQNVRAGQ